MSQSETDALVGIKGWLLFYVITTIIGVFYLLTDPLILIGNVHPAYRIFIGVLVASGLISLYLIFNIRKPITRTYNIWLNLIEAAFVGFGSFQLDLLPTGIPTVIVLLVWAVYWIGSKRVRATYCR